MGRNFGIKYWSVSDQKIYKSVVSKIWYYNQRLSRVNNLLLIEVDEVLRLKHEEDRLRYGLIVTMLEIDRNELRLNNLRNLALAKLNTTSNSR